MEARHIYCVLACIGSLCARQILCTITDLFRLLRVVDQLSAKHAVPELARHTETEFVVKEVVSKMVLLEFLVPQGKVLVVKEVMCEIVADVSKDAATVSCTSSIPVVEEYSMCKLPERSSQSSEERRRHNKTILVHG